MRLRSLLISSSANLRAGIVRLLKYPYSGQLLRTAPACLQRPHRVQGLCHYESVRLRRASGETCNRSPLIDSGRVCRSRRMDCLRRLNPLSYKIRCEQKFASERCSAVLRLRDCEDGDFGEKEDTRDSIWNWSHRRLDCQVTSGKGIG